MGNYTKSEQLWTKNYLLVLLTNALISMNFFMLNPTFPAYIKDFTGNIGVVGIITGLFTLSAMLVRPVTGIAVDRYDRKRIFVLGIMLLCVSFTGYIFSKSILFIIITRLAHGIGWGFTTTAIATLASDIIPQSRMGEGIGYFSASSVLAMAAGPALGLEIMYRINAEAVFGVAAGCTLLSGIILFAFFKEVIEPNDKEMNNLSIQTSLFYLFEKTAILPALVGFFPTIVSSATTTFISLYAAERGIVNIGYFFAIQAAAVMISRPITGRLIDRRGFGIAVIPALLCTIAAMVILFAADKPILFVIAAFVYGLGFGTTSSSLQAMSVVKADSDRRGAANSTYFTGIDMGFGIGSVIAGFAIEAVGYNIMYLLCIIPLFTGLAVFVLGGGIKLKRFTVKAELAEDIDC